MIFSVQNNNLMFSVEFSADLVQIQVRETVCGVFLARMDIPIQIWHMVEVMFRDFNEHPITQVPPTENQLGYFSRYVAQPFDDFLLPWEEGSVDNPITIEEDEGFSEPRNPVSEPPVMEARPALRSIENLQNSSAARQLFDL